MQVINILQRIEWKDSYIFATADGASLYIYTIISHTHGREAVEHFLGRDDVVHDQRELILSLLDFAMTHNYLWYGGSY